MSKRIIVDGPGVLDDFIISDAAYAAVDWGNGIDDSVEFTAENGDYHMYKLLGVTLITVLNGSPLPPGTYPGHEVKIISLGGHDAGKYHVVDAVKTAIISQLTRKGQGSEDFVLEFDCIDGHIARVVIKNVAEFDIKAHTVLIPVPD